MTCHRPKGPGNVKVRGQTMWAVRAFFLLFPPETGKIGSKQARWHGRKGGGAHDVQSPAGDLPPGGGRGELQQGGGGAVYHAAGGDQADHLPGGRTGSPALYPQSPGAETHRGGQVHLPGRPVCGAVLQGLGGTGQKRRRGGGQGHPHRGLSHDAGTVPAGSLAGHQNPLPQHQIQDGSL